MAAVMDNNEAVSRWQGQREADTDSTRKNQIQTTAAAVGAGGDGRQIHVIAAIDDGGDGRH